MQVFNDIIVGLKPNISILPLFHACDVYSFRTILDSKKLAPQRCDVFTNEDLLYCFYGKSSYRTKYDLSTGNIAYYPSCIILNTEQLPDPLKIYPFDTGAFVKLVEIKEKFFHHSMKVTDFIIGNNYDNIRAFIEKIYTSNKNYYDSKPTIDINSISLSYLEVVCYLNLIKDSSSAKYDDRVSSIEVVFNDSIVLNGKTVKNIVVPKSFLDDKYISDVIYNDLQISNPITYETSRGNPNQYHGAITEKIKDFLFKEHTL